jgi:hypothetical protein
MSRSSIHHRSYTNFSIQIPPQLNNLNNVPLGPLGPKDEHFTAWTTVRYDDLSRFPTRIKAAATALFEEGLQGKFHIAAKDDSIRISRKPDVARKQESYLPLLPLGRP